MKVKPFSDSKQLSRCSPCFKIKYKTPISFDFTCFLHSKNGPSVTLSAKCFLFKCGVMLRLRHALKLQFCLKYGAQAMTERIKRGVLNRYHTPCFFTWRRVAGISNNCCESKHKTFIPQHLQISQNSYCLLHYQSHSSQRRPLALTEAHHRRYNCVPLSK